ncbi:hypothetical protein QBC44DRAFT_368672 [Cladorrhinum sp. PSN332]|nr:hypothetical protein QBC44DRAFT_368672 [Cladorrhinum sp. PSN332]
MFYTTPDTSAGPKSVRHQYVQFNLVQELQQVIQNEKIDPSDLLPSKPGDVPAPTTPGPIADDGLPDLPKLHPIMGKPESDGPETPHRIAIVGAGCSGLFLGMMIDYLREKIPNINLEYDIFEAGGVNRVGGRLFTYSFPAGKAQGPHDYYDVGGMRFPDNPVMQRVFELFAWLDMDKVPLERDTPNGKLIPYSMTNTNERGFQNEPFRYNDITKWGQYTDIAASAGESGDAFGFNQDVTEQTKDQMIPPEILKLSPGTIVDFAIRDLRNALKKDAEHGGQEGWDKLMKYDSYTTRQWLASGQKDLEPLCGEANLPLMPVPPFNVNTINFLEAMNGGTDWYDQAFSETVLESLDFDYGDEWELKKKSTYPWYCIMGGAQQLPIIMERKLKSKVTYNSTVTAIRKAGDHNMEIDLKDSCQSLKYSGVFNTTTLGCLRRIDTTQCSIPNATKMAMRSLAYGQSCKVGIKFSHAWWIYSLPKDRQIKTGGLGHSDLHIRTLVYPSYNILVTEDEPAVLLVSYTWQQDAERIGSIISRDSPNNEEELQKLLIRELARLHSTSPEEEAALFETINNSYMDHYAHDWSHDPNAAGAFVFFRAQQFSTLWPKIITPSGNLVMTGEAASPHHAWVVGAIESSVVGLYAWLYSRAFDVPGAIEAMNLIDGSTKLETAGEKDGKAVPFLGLPDYMPPKYAQYLGLVANARRERK